MESEGRQNEAVLNTVRRKKIPKNIFLKGIADLDSWARLSERLLCLVVVGEEEVRLTWPRPVPRQLSSTGCNRGYVIGELLLVIGAPDPGLISASWILDPIILKEKSSCIRLRNLD